ncbi:MAG: hypothetical protein JXB14_01820 [Candidatus Altiarchaeota archaeon]|nr:hypothetical protein [Candidatus Altiarchaeota archaeon]
MKKVLVYLDTAKLANPFDLLVALDNGFDHVLPYQGITAENCEQILQNARFPRGPEGAKSTVFLIGGDLEEAEGIFQKSRQIIRPPFQSSVILDPNGACTTASALVAKTEKLLGGARGRKVTILAGTGPIGSIATILFRNLGAQVTITSRTREKATQAAKKLSDDIRGDVTGMQAATPEERIKACESADAIVSTGTLGVQLLDSECLKKIKPKVVVDVNVVPPYGIEDVKPEMDGDDINGGIKALGGLGIGKLKNKIEAELLNKATKDIRFYDYNDALLIARDLNKAG